MRAAPHPSLRAAFPPACTHGVCARRAAVHVSSLLLRLLCCRTLRSFSTHCGSRVVPSVASMDAESVAPGEPLPACGARPSVALAMGSGSSLTTLMAASRW